MPIQTTASSHPQELPPPSQEQKSFNTHKAIALPNPTGVQFNAFYRQCSRRLDVLARQILAREHHR